MVLERRVKWQRGMVQWRVGRGGQRNFRDGYQPKYLCIWDTTVVGLLCVCVCGLVCWLGVGWQNAIPTNYGSFVTPKRQWALGLLRKVKKRNERKGLSFRNTVIISHQFKCTTSGRIIPTVYEECIDTARVSSKLVTEKPERCPHVTWLDLETLGSQRTLVSETEFGKPR